MTTVIPPLSPPSPRELDELVRSHLPLVGHIVRATLARVPAHVSRDDLMSAGMLGLVTAARSFDATRETAFGTYAGIRIRGAIADELRGCDWASRSARSRARAADQARDDLMASLHRTPTRSEVSQALGVSVDELAGIDADTARAGVLSLQALAPEDGEVVLPAAGRQPEAMLVHREQLGLLHDAIAELPDRLRAVVLGYYVQQRKMTDIAAELGVTESRVSQLRSEALGLLRVGMRETDDAVASPTAAATPLPTSPGRRAQARAALENSYRAAVASRSTLAARLDLTDAEGERRVARAV